MAVRAIILQGGIFYVFDAVSMVQSRFFAMQSALEQGIGSVFNVNDKFLAGGKKLDRDLSWLRSLDLPAGIECVV